MLVMSDRMMVLASTSALCFLVWDLLSDLEMSGYCTCGARRRAGRVIQATSQTLPVGRGRGGVSRRRWRTGVVGVDGGGRGVDCFLVINVGVTQSPRVGRHIDKIDNERLAKQVRGRRDGDEI